VVPGGQKLVSKRDEFDWTMRKDILLGEGGISTHGNAVGGERRSYTRDLENRVARISQWLVVSRGGRNEKRRRDEKVKSGKGYPLGRGGLDPLVFKGRISLHTVENGDSYKGAVSVTWSELSYGGSSGAGLRGRHQNALNGGQFVGLKILGEGHKEGSNRGPGTGGVVSEANLFRD